MGETAGRIVVHRANEPLLVWHADHSGIGSAVVDAARFDIDAQVAVEAADRLATPLSLVIVRAPASRRARERLRRGLRTAEGFVYDLGHDAHAVLLPGSTAWRAFTWALGLASRSRGTSCGVAQSAVGDDASSLLERALTGLHEARVLSAPAWIARPVPVST